MSSDPILRLLETGLSIIPLAGKKPRVPWKEFQSRRPTKDEVEAWIQEFPGCNWGVVTGSNSEVIVLDVDGEAGARSLKECGDLPPTWQTETARGTHQWFRHPGGDISSATGVRSGLDVRAEGGYVVVPPSLHESGKPYTWKHAPWDTPLADPPSSVLDLLRTSSTSQRPVTPHPKNDSRIITEGSRNDSFYRIGRQMHANGLGPDAITAALNIHNQDVCKPPLDQGEVERIACHAATQPDRPDFVANNSFPPPKGGIGKETNFAPMTLGELYAQEFEPRVWIWEHFLPAGSLVLLAAFMKVGKSVFLYLLLVAIAKGQPFLGYATQKVPILVLAVEEHHQDVRDRLKLYGAIPEEDPIHVHLWRLMSGNATIEAVKAYIQAHGIKLVVLDTLSRYWNIRDENDNAEIIRKCSPFLDLARETNCCVLLAHHDNKAGGEDGRSIRGGGALFGLVDQALMLTKRQGGTDTQRVLKTLGRYSETPKELIIDLQGNDYLNLGSTDDFNPAAYQNTLLTVLGETPKHVDELVTATGLSEKIVRKTLAELGESVEVSGAGKKGDPYRYRQNSFLSHPSPIGEETNSLPPKVPEES